MQQTLLTSQNKMQDQLFKVLDHSYRVIVNLAAQVSTNMSIIQHNMVLQQKGSTLDKFQPLVLISLTTDESSIQSSQNSDIDDINLYDA